ncbi:hypothetical protein [Sphingopyxis sp. LK2115]|uniref:hypothetical protein n=1 Tax=Sphingopyxis sp. LK2115 TaxID=2744558 RepID=UPI0016606382|nr:hypothetical protein [Sphingopyxis sp. LK2115]
MQQRAKLGEQGGVGGIISAFAAELVAVANIESVVTSRGCGEVTRESFDDGARDRFFYVERTIVPDRRPDARTKLIAAPTAHPSAERSAACENPASFPTPSISPNDVPPLQTHGDDKK